jgi:hypothetical protein
MQLSHQPSGDAKDYGASQDQQRYRGSDAPVEAAAREMTGHGSALRYTSLG